MKNFVEPQCPGSLISPFTKNLVPCHNKVDHIITLHPSEYYEEEGLMVAWDETPDGFVGACCRHAVSLMTHDARCIEIGAHHCFSPTLGGAIPEGYIAQDN